MCTCIVGIYTRLKGGGSAKLCEGLGAKDKHQTCVGFFFLEGVFSFFLACGCDRAESRVERVPYIVQRGQGRE